MEKGNKNVTKTGKLSEDKNLKEYKEASPYNYKKDLKDNYNKDIITSPKIYLEIQEEINKKKENILNFENLNEEDNQIKEIYDIIQYQNKRNIINKYLLDLFKETKMNEFLKSDLLFTGLDMEDLCRHMSSFLSLKIYKINEFIYSNNELSENIYLILKGGVKLYKLVETQKMFTAEEYYYYLYKEYSLYKQLIMSNYQMNKITSMDINEFLDIDSLINNVNKNKNTFPLYSIDDIPDLNKIILMIKLYIKFLENKKEKIPELFKQYNIPIEYLNCDKFLKRQISLNEFMEELTKNIKEREKYYMKYLGKETKYNVRINKFIKYKNLHKYCYFGNFELIDTKPFRKDYAISESESTILLAINKKGYSGIINKTQKERRKKEIDFLHDNFFFKSINRQYFESKIFIKFEIDKFYIGSPLSKQGEKINKFIFIEEGIVKSSINDISLLELPDKIRALYDFIIKKAKEYNIDQSSLIDFDINLNQKTHLKYELIEDTLKQKQTFTISKTEKGIIGDYEYFFNIPSLISSTVISKNNRIFFYNLNNFKKVNDETHIFNESLKRFSFYKLKSILKRMISIYNSNYSFSLKMIEDKLNENKVIIKDNNKEVKNNIININNSVESEKNYNSPINIFRKNAINLHSFVNTINDSFNSRYNSECQNYKNKKDINKFFSDVKSNQRTIYNFRPSIIIDDKGNSRQNKIISNMKSINITRNSIFAPISTIFKNSSGNFPFRTIKIKKTKDIHKNIFSKNLIDNNTEENYNRKLKHKKNIGNKILNIILPPVRENINKSTQTIEHRSNTINTIKKIKRYALHTVNSINNDSLGHTDKNNIDEIILTNCDLKRTKKSKSIDIKKAQIIVLKNRDKKAKLLLRKKNFLEYFIDEDLY